jgi:hypothetical protein
MLPTRDAPVESCGPQLRDAFPCGRAEAGLDNWTYPDQEEFAMARLAIVLYEGSPGWRELRLGLILDFFGVPWKMVGNLQLKDLDEGGLEYVVFGSIRNVTAALRQGQTANSPTAYYAYLDEDRNLCLHALRSLLGNANLSLEAAPAGNLSIRVSEEPARLTGPMAGLKFPLRLDNDDAVLMSTPPVAGPVFRTVISADNAPVFLQIQQDRARVFLCTSSQMVNIDQPIREGFYDVKHHFCSVVPLVMFIRFVFPDVAWQPQELGACLIIDDPLLKPKYGFCNFAVLHNLMRRFGFTTNIAFIPWNWRRTSAGAGKFFNFESGLFSVSIHGCDHTAGEFAATSPEVLNARAQLARFRMRNHEMRTGIKHDSVMVFPQGAFSSVCPEVLKRNGFLAAVNTEIVPMDSQNSRTRIKDVWDVAILTYGEFPIFTRRYSFHGLENFAFDLLLGKPCLIVAHHDFFKDNGVALVELIERIGSLNCDLHWRPLGQVIRRACRRRSLVAGVEELEMYASELLVGNPSDHPIEVRIRKRKSHDDLASKILCDEKLIMWETEGEYFVFGNELGPHEEKCFRLLPPEQADAREDGRPWRLKLAAAARRIFSEFRDDYLSTSHLLGAPAEKLKDALKKVI